MRLLAHNMLRCSIAGEGKGYPLKIIAEKFEINEQDFSPDFLKHIFPKLDWPVFQKASTCFNIMDLPNDVTPDLLADENFLRKFHHALLEIDLKEGSLVCPDTGRIFSVSKGIPNMILNKDEMEQS